MIPSRPLRILALHGRQQNGTRFAKKTAPLRNALHGSIEIVYLTAPHLFEKSGGDVADVEGREAVDGRIEVNELTQYTWWSAIYEPKDKFYQGFVESLELLKKVLEQGDPFDGVMGFSQGACLLGFLCALLENPEIFPSLSSPIKHPPFRFGLSICGFKMRSKYFAPFYARPIHVRSLHIIARTDEIVTIEEAEQFAEQFVGPKEVYYDGGHFIPMDPDFLEIYKDFITESTGLPLMRSQL